MGAVVGFGEIMVRLSPHGYLKILQANDFDVNYTGAEANMCVSLARFGMDTQLVTKLPADNDVTDATINKMRQYGVGVDHIAFGGDRIGLYYLERGASQRPSKIIYDRKYSSISMADAGDFEWDAIMENASWFHFTGITAGLSDTMPALCEAACKAAKAHGVTISCDLNYRKKLWSKEKARSVMTHLMQYVDVLIGNEEDAETTLGIAPKNTDVTSGELNYDMYARLAEEICEKFPVKQVAFTLRGSISASENMWAAMLYSDGEAHFSKNYLIHLVDRVGGGDSFSAGLIYGMLNYSNLQEAIEFATAASCLKQAIEQDFNLSSVNEVRQLMSGDGSGRVQR